MARLAFRLAGRDPMLSRAISAMGVDSQKNRSKPSVP